MGVVLKCDVCASANFQTESYEQWLDHLMSSKHQLNATSNNNLQPRKKWTNEDDSYVLTGINGGLPCGEKQLLKWISERGILTEYIYYNKNVSNRHILFTLTSIMPGSHSNILKETVPFGRGIVIRPKSEFGLDEWNTLINGSGKAQKQKSNNNNPVASSNSTAGLKTSASGSKTHVPSQSSSNSSTASFQSQKSGNRKKSNKNLSKNSYYPSATILDQSSSSCMPKNTLVFTNSNLSSATPKANLKSAKTPSASQSVSNLSVTSANSDCLSERSNDAGSRSSGCDNRRKNKGAGNSSSFDQKQNAAIVQSSIQQNSESSVSCSISAVAVDGSPEEINCETSALETAQGGGKKKKRSKGRSRKSKEQTPDTGKEQGHLEQRGKKSRVVLPPSTQVVSASQTPLRSHLHDVMKKVNQEMESSTTTQVQSKPEQLNFRGGFLLPGRSRTDSQRMSESSDGSAHVIPTRETPSLAEQTNEPLPVQQPQQKVKNRNAPSPSKKSFHQKQKSEQYPPPQIQVLQRPQSADNRNEVPNSQTHHHHHHHQHHHHQQQQRSQQVPVNSQTHPQLFQNQWPPLQAVPQRPGYQRVPVPGPSVRPQMAMGPTPHVYPQPMYAPGAGVPPRHYHPQHQVPFFVSPTFTSQIPPSVASHLQNPNWTRSKNPFKFNANTSPPFPYFFDLFQKLPIETFNPKKNTHYIEFCRIPLAHQLDHFYTALSLPQSEIILRWQVILDILVILRNHFANCEVHPFGSIITGLGDFGSDIDIYVDLKEKISSQEAVDRVKKIFRKSICPHSKTPFVKNLIPVKSARVPILKLSHRATDINCDLSFENRLSVQNTKMLTFYLNQDPRLFRFMVLVRYWAKYHHVTGSNHIKNYALTLLVLVYLCQKRLVPPLLLLQQLKQIERDQNQFLMNPDEIDGWDSSFCDNILAIRQAGFKPARFPGAERGEVSETTVLIKMALEFFEMCADTDFSSIVVCPLLGEFVPKKQFEPGSEEELPDTLDRYKNWAVKQDMNRRLNINCCLCIQDPFVLSFNVGCVTPMGTLLKFQIAAAYTAHLLRTNNLKSFPDVFIPLPEHIGEKKFMKILKAEQMADDLMLEVKNKLGVPLSRISQIKDPSQNNQASSKLPFPLPNHLKRFETLLAEKSLKAALKRGKWETFLDFNLSSEFESLFIAELARCQIRESRKITQYDLTLVLSGLWKEFTVDFLRNIFQDSLGLDVIDTKSSHVDTFSKPLGRKPRWKLRYLSKKEEDKIEQTKKSIYEVNNLFKKIRDYEPIPLQIDYRMWTIKVSYPFWEKRSSHELKAAQEIKEKGNVIQVPIIPSPKDIRKEEKDKRKKVKGKDLDANKVCLKACFDPLVLEKRATELLREKQEEQKTQAAEVSFIPFKFNIFVKFEASSLTDKPQLIFIFEKDPNMKQIPPEYLPALSTISNILSDSFPSYQMYRLAKWLDASVDVPDPLPEVPKDESVANATVSTAAGEKKKKKRRTKQEEDLLIPSSSSSICSANDDLSELEDEEEEDGKELRREESESDDDSDEKGEEEEDNSSEEDSREETDESSDEDNENASGDDADEKKDEEKEKEPAQKEKEPAQKEKEPAQKENEPAQKEKEPAQKEKEPAQKEKEPAQKENEPAQKEKEPAQKVKDNDKENKN